MEIISANNVHFKVNIENEDELKLLASAFFKYQDDYVCVDDYFNYLNGKSFRSRMYYINKKRNSELMSILREIKLKRILDGNR